MTKKKTLTYEVAIAELEQLLVGMESEQMSLEASLAAYQRGATLLAFCRERLDDAQQQVKVLEQGELKPFMLGELEKDGSSRISEAG